MKKVYVIIAGAGEYSDRSERPFLVVEDKERAQQYMKSLETIETDAWGGEILSADVGQ